MGDVLIQLNDFYKVLTHGAYSRGTASHTHSQSSYISKVSRHLLGADSYMHVPSYFMF